jgi:beta-glucosidase
VSDCDAVKDISDNHKYAPDRGQRGGGGDAGGCRQRVQRRDPDRHGRAGDRYREALKRGLITDGGCRPALVRLFSARYPRRRPAGQVRKATDDPPRPCDARA